MLLIATFLYFWWYGNNCGGIRTRSNVTISVTISSITLPFVENESRARAVKDQIDAIYHQTGVRPLVFYSIVLPEIRAIILQSEGFCQDIVQALVAPLQQEMKLIQRRLLIVPMALTLIISINMMRALRRLITPRPRWRHFVAQSGPGSGDPARCFSLW